MMHSVDMVRRSPESANTYESRPALLQKPFGQHRNDVLTIVLALLLDQDSPHVLADPGSAYGRYCNRRPA